MIQKTCNFCGKFCWHNKCVKAQDNSGYRCTYCGSPVTCATAGSSKREHANHIRNTQANKYRATL